MDPVTQVSLGAAAAALVSRPASLRSALIIGAIAGAVPDLDVLIQSEHDPLLSLEYHRHFSHSLFMVPVIGCLVALVYKGLLRSRAPDVDLRALCVMGTLSHGLLDACTSYGTRLYWPFSQYRESWVDIHHRSAVYSRCWDCCSRIYLQASRCSAIRRFWQVFIWALRLISSGKRTRHLRARAERAWMHDLVLKPRSRIQLSGAQYISIKAHIMWMPFEVYRGARLSTTLEIPHQYWTSSKSKHGLRGSLKLC